MKRICMMLLGRRGMLALLALCCLAPMVRADVLWEPFRSAVDGFQILFPGKPKEERKDFGKGAVYHSFILDRDETAFLVIYTEYAPGTFVGKDAKLILDKARDDLIAGQKVTVRADHPIEFGRFSGRELVIDDANGSTQIYRLYVVGDRLYQVICGGPKGFDTTNDAHRFEDSFRLVGQ